MTLFNESCELWTQPIYRLLLTRQQLYLCCNTVQPGHLPDDRSAVVVFTVLVTVHSTAHVINIVMFSAELRSCVSTSILSVP
jgi:hypothetical protein